MTDASFSVAGYVVLLEDNPLEKYTSTRKTFAPVAYGSKTFSLTQFILSIYAKNSLQYFFAFEVGEYTNRQQISHTIFQTKLIPLTLWKAYNHVIQFNFTFAHFFWKNQHDS